MIGDKNNPTNYNYRIPPSFRTIDANKPPPTTTTSMGVVAASTDVLQQTTAGTKVPKTLSTTGRIAKENAGQDSHRGRGNTSAGRPSGIPGGRRGTSAHKNPKWSAYEDRVLIWYWEEMFLLSKMSSVNDFSTHAANYMTASFQGKTNATVATPGIMAQTLNFWRAMYSEIMLSMVAFGAGNRVSNWFPPLKLP